MASTSRQQAKPKCSDCNNFTTDPEIGHFKCIKHRACSGAEEWQPEECDACMYLILSMKNLSVNPILSHLTFYMIF